MFSTCVPTVFGLITSWAAISGCVRPSPSSLRTWSSRGDRPELRPRRGATMSHEQADAGEQLVRFERLHEVVVGPHPEPGDAVERLHAGPGHEHDRERPVLRLAQPPADLVARETRKADVQKDDVGIARSRELERLLPGARLERLVLGVGEQVRHQRAQAVVVIDDQDRRRADLAAVASVSPPGDVSPRSDLPAFALRRLPDRRSRICPLAAGGARWNRQRSGWANRACPEGGEMKKGLVALASSDGVSVLQRRHPRPQRGEGDRGRAPVDRGAAARTGRGDRRRRRLDRPHGRDRRERRCAGGAERATADGGRSAEPRLGRGTRRRRRLPRLRRRARAGLELGLARALAESPASSHWLCPHVLGADTLARWLIFSARRRTSRSG